MKKLIYYIIYLWYKLIFNKKYENKIKEYLVASKLSKDFTKQGFSLEDFTRGDFIIFPEVIYSKSNSVITIRRVHKILRAPDTNTMKILYYTHEWIWFKDKRKLESKNSLKLRRMRKTYVMKGPIYHKIKK